MIKCYANLWLLLLSLFEGHLHYWKPLSQKIEHLLQHSQVMLLATISTFIFNQKNGLRSFAVT